jgi:hypothetical protein
MNTDHTRHPDRLIWLSLLSVLAAALIADQARANLHTAARAEAVLTAEFDQPMTAEAWCRMYRDALVGDEAISLDGASSGTSAVRSMRPVSVHSPNRRRSRYADALR